MVKIPTTDHNPYNWSKSLLKFFSLNCTSHNPYSLKWVSRTQLKSLRTQLKSLQTQLKSLQTQLKSLQTQLKSLQTQLKSLQRPVKIPTQSSKSLRSQLSKSCSIKIPTSRDFDWSISVFCETIANPHLPPYFGTLDDLSLGHLLPRHLPLNYGKDKVCLQKDNTLKVWYQKSNLRFNSVQATSWPKNNTHYTKWQWNKLSEIIWLVQRVQM